jgi:C1A family cysteine protease
MGKRKHEAESGEEHIEESEIEIPGQEMQRITKPPGNPFHLTSGGHMLGWRRQHIDHRDKLLKDHIKRLFKKPHKIPSATDISKLLHPVYDQGQLGSCTGNGGAVSIARAHSAYLYLGEQIDYSRLWLYYQARALEGSVDYDAGAEVRDIFKAANKVGVLLEKDWPYDIETFADTPTQEQNDAALKHILLSYYAIKDGDLGSVQQCLVGSETLAPHPVCFGCPVYEAINNPPYYANRKKHIIPMPRANEAPEGGHCMDIIGYDNRDQTMKVRNSWGPAWGDAGEAWIPYEYFRKLCTDLWVSIVEADAQPPPAK